MENRDDFGQSTNTWYSSLDDEIADIAIILRKLIHTTVPKVIELIKWGTPVFDCKGIICALRSGKGFIALQFYEIGINLKDPDGILESTGKKMRHVKIYSLKDIKDEIFQKWIKCAADNNLK